MTDGGTMHGTLDRGGPRRQPRGPKKRVWAGLPPLATPFNRSVATARPLAVARYPHNHGYRRVQAEGRCTHYGPLKHHDRLVGEHSIPSPARMNSQHHRVSTRESDVAIAAVCHRP